MPNWVDNTIVITGDKEKIKAIKDKVEVKNTDDGETTVNIATSLFPMPQDLKYVIGTQRDTLRYAKVGNKVVIPPSDLEMMSRDVGYDILTGTSKQFSETKFEIVNLTEGEKKQLEQNHGATNWYDWNCNNYGSKWGDCYTRIVEEEDDKLVYSFETAWVSGAKLAHRISEEFDVDVKMNHFSIENWEEGKLKFSRGKCMEENWRVLDDDYEKYLQPVNTEEE